jgi:hypothetical protein
MSAPRFRILSEHAANEPQSFTWGDFFYETYCLYIRFREAGLKKLGKPWQRGRYATVARSVITLLMFAPLTPILYPVIKWSFQATVTSVDEGRQVADKSIQIRLVEAESDKLSKVDRIPQDNEIVAQKVDLRLEFLPVDGKVPLPKLKPLSQAQAAKKELIEAPRVAGLKSKSTRKNGKVLRLAVPDRKAIRKKVTRVQSAEQKRATKRKAVDTARQASGPTQIVPVHDKAENSSGGHAAPQPKVQKKARQKNGLEQLLKLILPF